MPGVFIFSLNVFSSQRSDKWHQVTDVKKACRYNDYGLMKQSHGGWGRNQSSATGNTDFKLCSLTVSLFAKIILL